MTCNYWRNEDFFCVKKQKTVNPDELLECAENCSDYSPNQEAALITCNNCGEEFQMTESNIVEVRNRQYIKCTKCGSVMNLKRNEVSLGR